MPAKFENISRGYFLKAQSTWIISSPDTELHELILFLVCSRANWTLTPASATRTLTRSLQGSESQAGGAPRGETGPFQEDPGDAPFLGGIKLPRALRGKPKLTTPGLGSPETIGASEDCASLFLPRLLGGMFLNSHLHNINRKRAAKSLGGANSKLPARAGESPPCCRW